MRWCPEYLTAFWQMVYGHNQFWSPPFPLRRKLGKKCFIVKNLALPKEISERKSTLNIHCQEWCWSSNTWLPDSKSWLIGKYPDARKDCLNRCKFEQTLGDSEGQESLECCSPWGCQESDTTEQLNNNKREPDLCPWLLESKLCLEVELVVKKLSATAGDVRNACSIPEFGRSPGEGDGNPLQHSCLENPMDRGAWQGTVHRVAKSRTRLKQCRMYGPDKRIFV